MTSRSERVQITFHALKLKNVAGAFKGTSDPYAIVTVVATEPGVNPKILGKTEVIKNSLSPHWVTVFEVDYEFAKPFKLNVGIYDEIRKSKTNKSMGSAVFEVGEVLGSRGNIKAKKLKDGGTLFCRVEKAPEVYSGLFHFQLRGVKLKNLDGMFSKSNPFFEISKQIDSAGGLSWQVVYRSEAVLNDLNPKWKADSISVNELCGGEKDRAILISVKDWDKKGKHKSMGFFETTLNALAHAKVHSGSEDVKSIDMSKAFDLTKKGQSFGSIVVTEARIEGANSNLVMGSTPLVPTASFVAPTAPIAPTAPPANAHSIDEIPQTYNAKANDIPSVGYRPKFVDYISGGLELQLSVAVDYTGSNGDPRIPGTLHYIDLSGGQLNDYEKALSAVGEIIAKYDSDQKFPMRGFGAKYGGVIKHCFQLGPTAEVIGIKGMLDAYRATFHTGLVMSGPTVFAEVIQLAAAEARSKQEASRRIGQQAYHVLLILTDGAVSDVNQTKEAIRAASDAPLSIVIVGIGNADFSAMEFLDDFQKDEKGRDICQFVEFQRFKSNKIHLTQATLEEIPDQVVDYFHSHGIKPLPSIRGSQVEIVAEEYNEAEEMEINLDFGEDGEINLKSGGYMDDTIFGTYDNYAELTPIAPPPSTAPQGYNSDGQSYQQPFTVQPMAPPRLHGQPYGNGPPQIVPARVVAKPFFLVQLPPGVSAGQQLQIQNPQTNQPMIVSVPTGIPPGGTFPVSY